MRKLHPKSPCALNAVTGEWHQDFLRLLPTISRHARCSFRHLQQEAREDAVAEVVANALVAFRRLAMAGRQDLAYATPLARYGALRYRSGRRVGSSFRSTEVLSKACQRRQGFAVQSIDVLDDGLLDHQRVAPSERAATRLDFTLWLESLAARDRALVELLATGETTQAAAARFQLTPGRISQLRRQYYRKWQEFLGETHSPSA
jgi:DNA-binding NarL/FixJ family response regulator